VVLLASTGLAATIAYQNRDAGRCKRPYTDVRTCEVEKGEGLLLASFFTAAGLYVYGVWDARRAVRRSNVKRGLRIGSVEIAPLVIFSTASQAHALFELELLKVNGIL
jgi:hypothetical protein